MQVSHSIMKMQCRIDKRCISSVLFGEKSRKLAQFKIQKVTKFQQNCTR